MPQLAPVQQAVRWLRSTQNAPSQQLSPLSLLGSFHPESETATVTANASGFVPPKVRGQKLSRLSPLASFHPEFAGAEAAAAIASGFVPPRIRPRRSCRGHRLLASFHPESAVAEPVTAIVSGFVSPRICCRRSCHGHRLWLRSTQNAPQQLSRLSLLGSFHPKCRESNRPCGPSWLRSTKIRTVPQKSCIWARRLGPCCAAAAAANIFCRTRSRDGIPTRRRISSTSCLIRSG